MTTKPKFSMEARRDAHINSLRSWTTTAAECMNWVYEQGRQDEREKAKGLVEALESANEFTSSILEDMEHYFDNKCCPTADEVNQCAIADSGIRLALEAYNKAQDEKDGIK